MSRVFTIIGWIAMTVGVVWVGVLLQQAGPAEGLLYLMPAFFGPGLWIALLGLVLVGVGTIINRLDTLIAGRSDASGGRG